MYKFRFEVKNNDIWEALDVSPIYDDNAKLSVKRESGEMFCRYDFDGSFTFMNEDYYKFISSGIFTVRFDDASLQSTYGGNYSGGKYEGHAVIKKEDNADILFAIGEDGYYELYNVINGLLVRVVEDTSIYIKKRSMSEIENGTTVFSLEDGEGRQPVEIGSMSVVARRTTFSAEYRMVISYDENNVSTDILECYFSMADMDFDNDNKIAKLKLKGKDKYEDFLNKYDTEYDLVQLAPDRSSVEMYKRAFLQIYVRGDSKISHILGNFEYEVNAVNNAEDKTREELETIGFVWLKAQSSINLSVNGVWNPSYGDIWGEYLQYGGTYVSPTGKYFLYENVNLQRYEVWNRQEQEPTGFYFSNIGQYETVYNEGRPSFEYGVSETIEKDIMGRIITDSESDYTSTINSNDIWDNNLNYRFYKELADRQLDNISDRVIISSGVTSTPNKWMRNDQGLYFVQPSPMTATERVIAIGWNQWGGCSYWFRNDVSVTEDFNAYDVKWTLKDAYRIQDAINSLLGKISDGITLESDFLYNIGLGGYSNPILGGGEEMWLYITPVTNIKKTYYEQAAQKGKITLKQILDMLKYCFQCYWFLQYNDGEWKLRIEHIDWFRNGGSYEEKIIEKDLSTEKVVLSRKPWITDQRKCSFDLSEIKSRISFEWGDKSSELFNGRALQSESAIAKGTSEEKFTVANFVADIDIIESSPESISDDLYAVIGADDKGVVKMDKIGYYDGSGALSQSHPQFMPQNSFLPFYFTEQKFWNYNVNVPNEGRVVMVNDENDEKLPIKIDSYKPIVSEKVTIPFPIKKPDLCKELFVTDSSFSQGLGGNIESITTDIFTQVSEIELSFTFEL